MIELKHRRLVVALGIAFSAGAGTAGAETVDFESAVYVAEKSIEGVDGWQRTLGLGGDSESFHIQAPAGNKFVRCLTAGQIAVARPFTEQSGQMEAKWRWRAQSDSVNFCVGIGPSGDIARLSTRAKACMTPQGKFQGVGMTTDNVPALTWKTGTWYYMRLLADNTANHYSLYADTAAAFANPILLIGGSAMNSLGAPAKAILSAQGGKGSVDVDDMDWNEFPVAIWTGKGGDSSWSNAENWSGGAVPGKEHNVIFDAGSPGNCLVDKPANVASIAVSREYKGIIRLGANTLTVLGRADFSGGAYTYSSGSVRLSAGHPQILIGPAAKPMPPVVHDGTGILRLEGRQLNTAGFTQTSGTLDFNGFDLIAEGDLNIKNGGPSSLSNLGGRNLSAGGSSRLEGTAAGALNLNPASEWKISVTSANTLEARYAVIGNSSVISGGKGLAIQSSNAGGNTNWNFALPPVVTAEPKDQSVLVGQFAAFAVSASSNVAMKYQWHRNDQPIAGAVDSVYSLGARKTDSGAGFSCVITNLAGYVTSRAARLTVTFPAPIAQPQPQEIIDSLVVSLFTSVTGANIHYSRNGGAFTPYTKPIVLRDSTSLSAFAVSGQDTGAVGSWIYPKRSLPQADMPAANPPGGSFADTFSVALSTATMGDAIFYTLDNSDPDTLKGRYTGPIPIRATSLLRAIAVKQGYKRSPILSAFYSLKTADTLARPLAVPAGGSFRDTVLVRLSPPASSPNAAIYFTVGAGPLTKYDQPFVLRSSAVVKAFAILQTQSSDTAVWFFTRLLEAPVAAPKGKSFTDTLWVSLSAKSGASIYYTVDGIDPDSNSRRFSTPLLLDSSVVLKARTYLAGSGMSAIQSETYLLIPDTPSASPRGGDYVSAIPIQLQASSARARIYYTLDGSTPGPENGQLYAKPFNLDTNATLKAVAVAGQGTTLQKGPMLTQNYTFFNSGKRILGAGQRLELSSNYSLISPMAEASSVQVEVLPNDSIKGLRGFRDIQFGIRLTLPSGATVFPQVLFTAARNDGRSLFGLAPPSMAVYIASTDTVEVPAQGTYFLAVDTLAPQIVLAGEKFTASDSTQAVFSVTDNVSNLLLDVERSDNAGLNVYGRAIGSPDLVVVNLKNPDGVILPLTVRVAVSDHRQKATYPPDPAGTYPLSQKSKMGRSPAILRIGARAEDPWDLVGIPLSLNPPPTLAQLRKNNGAGLTAAVWEAATETYRYLKDNEAMPPGKSVWLGSTSSLNSLAFPALTTSPLLGNETYTVTLRKGWNQVANPSLQVLHWPVTRRNQDHYDASPVKGLRGYVSDSSDYFPAADSLAPWKGYFVFYKGDHDTVVALRSTPVPAAAKPGARPRRDGVALLLGMHRSPSLRLGASPGADDGLGIEDEPQLPSRSGASSLWSLRDSRRLGTDVIRWTGHALLRWKIVAGMPDPEGNSPHTETGTLPQGARIDGLDLPEGYQAWAVSSRRGMRFRLETGGAIPIHPGLPDSLDVYAGSAGELEARLGSIPLSVEAFRLEVSQSPGGFSLHVRLPESVRIRWTLWSMAGRALAGDSRSLPEGVYVLPGSRGRPPASGLYVLKVEWFANTGTPGAGSRGRLVRKLAVP